MKNRFLNIALFIGISFSLVSCETGEKTVSQKNNEKQRNTLRINFEENILTLNPRVIASPSEKFVGFLLYEGLYKLNNDGKTTPVLIKHCLLDTLNNTFFFKIKASIAFQNGDILNSSHIYERFKEIIDFDEANSNEGIRSFRNEIKGYKKYSIRKIYKIGNDSLPEGFKIIDNLNFSIQFTKSQPELFTLLSKPDFWIYQTAPNNKFIGTGSYLLNYANEDISYHLIKNKNYHAEWGHGLENINIRFIKNKNALLNEFLNGSLDLLVQNANMKDDTLDNQYAHYKKTEGSSSMIKHLSLVNINNPNMEKLMLQLLVRNIEERILNYDKYTKQINYSTVIQSEDTMSYYAQQLHYSDSMPKIRIPIITNCKQNCTQEIETIKTNLSRYYDLYEVNKAVINLNAPYIVINESNKHIYTELADNSTLFKLYKQNKISSYSKQSLIILGYQRAEVYTNIMLKGLNPYTDWTKELDNFYFTEPKVY